MFAFPRSKRRRPEQDLAILINKTVDEMKAYRLIQDDFILIRMTVGSSIGSYKNRKLSAGIEKAMGAKAGLLDTLNLWRCRATGRPMGLFIELKIKGNYLQENQKDFIRQLKLAGFNSEVVHSVDEYLQVLERYGVQFKKVS